MNKIFENELFDVMCLKEANTYFVFNRRTGALEETSPSEYEATRYAVLRKKQMDDLLKQDEWPADFRIN